MAGSRLEKMGNIFTRTRGLLRSGVMPEAKKPIWYEVYAAFPPLVDTTYQDAKPEDDNKEDPIRPILYPEDKIRAKFYRVYGNGPRAFVLSRLNFKSPCQRFVEKYNRLQQRGEVDEDRLFEETAKALMAEGLLLQKQAAKNLSITSEGIPVAPSPSQEAALNTEPHRTPSGMQGQEQAPELAEDVPKEGPLSP